MKEFKIENTTDKYDYCFQVAANEQENSEKFNIVSLNVGLHEETLVAIKMFNYALLSALKDFSIDTSEVTFDPEGSAFYGKRKISYLGIEPESNKGYMESKSCRGYTHIPAIVHLMMIKEGIDPEKFIISFKKHIEDLV